MLKLIRNHPLISFFLLAFGLSWGILIPLVLSSYGLVPAPPFPLLIVMGYGPTTAAIVMSTVVGGRAEVKALLKRLLIWRVGWRWWAATLFLNGLLILGANVLYGLLGNPVPPFPELAPSLLLDVVLTFLMVSLINGEEIGWRGFALPRLQKSYGFAATVVVLGVLETLFHLPIFFNNGASEAGGQNGVPFAAFLVTSLLAVPFFIWLYNGTRGSLLMATLMHGSMNAWSSILPFPAQSDSFFWLIGVMQAIGLVVIYGVQRLSAARSPALRTPAVAIGAQR